MASPIIFRVQDGVDPQIAQNVAAIGNAAKSADASVQALTQALQAINNSGVAGLATQLSAASSSTTRLSNTTAKMGAAALTASQNIDKLVTSYGNLNSIVTASITTLSSFAVALRTSNSSTANFTQSVRKAGSAGHESVSGVQAASAAIRGLEGNFGTSVRAGERFLVTSLKLGPILQTAFPIFGALALAGVLDIVASHITKLIDAFKALSIAERNSEVASILSGEKLLKVKPESFFSSSNFARILDDNPNTPKNLDIVNAQSALRQINAQKEIADANALANEQGLQGLNLQNAKVKAIQDEITFTKQAKLQVDALTDSYAKQLKETTLDSRQVGTAKTGFRTITEEHLKITDPSQVKALESELKTAKDAAFNLNTQIEVLNAKLRGQIKAEPLAEAKDEAKQATAQLKLFADQLAKLKGQDHLVSPQEKLDLLTQQRDIAARTHPANVPNLDAQIGTQVQAIELQKRALDDLDKKYQDQVDEIGLVTEARRIASAQSRIEIELIKSGNDPYSKRAQLIKDNAALTISQFVYQKELNKVYNEATEPLKLLVEGTRAINDLESQGLITHNQALIAQNELNKSYRDATQPLFEYSKGLQDQIDLLGKYGIAATVATEIQRIQNDLRSKGRSLNEQELQQLSQFLTYLEKQKQLQAAVNQLYEQNAGQVEKLTASILALNVARQKGIISETQYDVQLAKLRIELANVNIELGKFGKGDVLTSVFGNFIKDFKGFIPGIIQTWQTAFDTIADGAANALGRAIAYGEDLGKALQDVARQALSEIISGFIKLGIQLLINSIINKTVGESALAIASAQAAALAAAWAPAAAFASLASFGANAAPADASLASTVAFAQILGALHFATGGIVPGYGNKDTVPALLTPGESVLTRAATRFLGVSTIQAWNQGRYAVATSGTGSSASGQRGLVLNLIHDKNAVDVVKINQDTIRVIAKQEAVSAVNTHAPSVIAGQIADPNSSVRKSLGQNTNVRGAH
jgi:hypothetical protein